LTIDNWLKPEGVGCGWLARVSIPLPPFLRGIADARRRRTKDDGRMTINKI